MAGRPKRRALIHELTKRAVEECEDGTAHLDYVVRWIESGKTLTQLAREISLDAGEDIFGPLITRYLSAQYSDYEARMRAARAVGAFAMVDEARDIVDELDAGAPDKNDIAVARARSDVRLWTAERFNRKELGAAKDVQVSVSINTLHLDALRTRTTAKLTDSSSERDTQTRQLARAFNSDESGSEPEYTILNDDSAIDTAIPIE